MIRRPLAMRSSRIVGQSFFEALLAGKQKRQKRRGSKQRRETAAIEHLEDRAMLAADLMGSVFEDLNENGVQEPGELGIDGTTVYLDLNDNQVQDTGQILEPDDFAAGTVVGDASPGVTVWAKFLGDLEQLAQTANAGTGQASTGNQVFANGSGDVAFSGDAFRLDIHPTSPVTSISLDFTAIDAGAIGQLQFFNANHVLLSSDTTFSLSAGQTQTISMSHPDIAYATATSTNNLTGTLDNLQINGGMDPTAITDSNGNYLFTGLDAGNYIVRQMVPAGYDQTTPNSTIPRLFAVDPNVTHATQIVEVDPATGATVNSFAAPGTIGGTTAGLAFDGQTIYLIDSNDDTLYELDPDTGSVLDSMALNPDPRWDGLAVLNGLVYANDTALNIIEVIDPATNTIVDTINVPPSNFIPSGGLGELPTANGGQLVAPIGISSGVVLLDPVTGTPVSTFSHNYVSNGDNFGVTSIDGEIYLGFDDSAGTVQVYTPDGTFVRSFQTAFGMSALGAAGSSDPAHRITLTDGQTLTGVDFGNREAIGDISGNKFNDANGNGLRDQNEAPLPQTTIYIDANDNGLLDTNEVSTITDANGDYSFTGIPVGDHIIRDVTPAGYVRTTPINQAAFYYAFGNGFQDLVRIDTNSGIVTTIGPHFAGTELTGLVVTNDGQLIAASLQRNEIYSVDPQNGLATLIGHAQNNIAGDLAYDSKTDTIYAVTRDGDARIATVDINTGIVTPYGPITSDFEAASAITIHPQTGNLIAFDPIGDEYFEIDTDTGVGTMLAISDSSFFTQGLTTNGSQFILPYNDQLYSLDPNTATLTPHLTLSSSQTLAGLEFVPKKDGTHRVTINVGDNISNLDFGSREAIGDISGNKFNDANGNGLRDQNEDPLPQTTIFLDANDNGLLDTNEVSTITDANGDYSFTGIPVGDHIIRDVTPAGYIRTTPINQAAFYYAFGNGFQDLVRIDTNSGIVTTIGPHFAGTELTGLVVTNDGQLIAASLQRNEIYSINPQNGLATLIGHAQNNIAGDLAYDSKTDTIYAVTRDGDARIATVDINTGIVTPYGPITSNFEAASAITIHPQTGNLIAFDPIGDEYFEIDTDTGVGTMLAISDSSFFTRGLTTNGSQLILPIDDQLYSLDPNTATLTPHLTLSSSQTLAGLEFVPKKDGTHRVTINVGDNISNLDFGSQNAPLVLNIVASSIAENGGVTMATVSRVGSTSGDLVVSLSSDETNEISFPVTTITIPSGSTTSDPFVIAAVDNEMVDGQRSVVITASGGPYLPGLDTLTITDNDVPTLTVVIDTSSISENGGSTTATVTRNTANADDLLVTLTSSDTTEALVPETVTILPGQSSVTFNIDGVDDNIFDGTKLVSITASRTNYVSSSATLSVTDDETPGISLSVLSTSISEAGGNTTGIVTLDAALETDLVVNLSSSDQTAATVPATITIPAGQMTGVFLIFGTDDNIVDGTQSTTISAEAPGIGNDSAELLVTDNDVSSLQIHRNLTSISENGGVAIGTAQLTTPLSTDLVISLNSDDTTEATVPATVTIPAGDTTATFEVTGVDDAIEDDAKLVTISAASDLNDSSFDILVSNDDVAQFAFSIAEDTIDENGGVATGTVSLTYALETDYVVDLSSNANGLIVFPTQVTIPAGTLSNEFPITAINNDVDDTDRLMTVTATSSRGILTDELTVIDDDTTTLSLTVDAVEISENGGTATATLSLSTPYFTSFFLSLSSDDTTEATVPTNVFVAAGNTTATFTITAVDDTILDSTQTVNITGTSLLGDVSATINISNDDVNQPATGTPTILGVTTETQTLTADTSSITDSDGLGTFTYQWLRDGVSIPEATTDSYTLTSADVGAQITVSASFIDGNGTNEGPLISPPTAVVTSTGTWIDLAFEDFENGIGTYIDGGRDARLYTGTTHSHQGQNSANLQDNSGSQSSITLREELDLTTPNYTGLRIEFWFKMVSFETGEDFFLEYSDGTNWQIIGVWARGADYQNNQFNFASVEVSDQDVTFSDNVEIRFRADASGNRDDVYLDEIRIQAFGQPAVNAPPVAVNDTSQVLSNDAVTINVLQNDSDPEDDSLTIEDHSQPDNGTVVNNGNGTLTYTPDAGFVGTDTFTYVISDGNGATSTAQVAIEVSAPPRWTDLAFEDFENGMASYIDGGRDAGLYTGGSRAHQGNNAAQLQDNSGTASSITLRDSLDLATPNYTSLKVEFWFQTVSFEWNEDFWLQYFDGSTWQTIRAFERGTDFQNDEFNFASVEISSQDYTFSSNAKIRLMSDASSDYDDVYIDEIRISAR